MADTKSGGAVASWLLLIFGLVLVVLALVFGLPALLGAWILGLPRPVLEVLTVAFCAAIGLPLAWRRSLPYQAHRLVRDLCGKKNEQDQPELQLRHLRSSQYTWLLAWRMPHFGTASRFISEREAIETRLNCSVEIWERGGLIWMRFGVNPLPRRVDYEAFYGS